MTGTELVPTPQQPTTVTAPKPPKLLDQVRAAIRLRHYSRRTEEAYTHWIVRYIRFHNPSLAPLGERGRGEGVLRHPAEMGAPEINQFLTHLAVEGHVSASTQNQAFNALLFLYRTVLERPFDQLEGVVRAKRPKRLPVVLTRQEVQRVIAELRGVYRLIALLQYGAGLRLLECLQLRVKDLDGGNNVIVVRHGKGGKDRRTMFPESVKPGLREHVRRVLALHRRDLARGLGAAPCPMRSTAKHPAPAGNFAGNSFFLRLPFVSIRGPASRSAFTCTRAQSRGLTTSRSGNRASASGPRVIRFVTRSPRTCWRPATTYAPCRSCWGNRT